MSKKDALEVFRNSLEESSLFCLYISLERMLEHTLYVYLDTLY